MKVLITGSNGFIARNLIQHLAENGNFEILKYDHESPTERLKDFCNTADFIFHLAGVNRPKNEAEFSENFTLTELLCSFLKGKKMKTPVLFASSIQATLNNPYGRSKKDAEDLLIDFSKSNGSSVFIFRLPNVFGKWSNPNYNSAIATFCNNISKGLPVKVNDASSPLTLVYIDDVVKAFRQVITDRFDHKILREIDVVYNTTVGEVVKIIQSFKQSRHSLIIESVGIGLKRALHATYLSFLTPDQFHYELPVHEDNRGLFVEFIKTNDAGQISFFTAYPGITRGEHYHHTKTEKFLVIKGRALFGFRNILTNEYYKFETGGGQQIVVETVPGWAHNITNIGDTEMIVLLWSSEIFDKSNPDTFASKV